MSAVTVALPPYHPGYMSLRLTPERFALQNDSEESDHGIHPTSAEWQRLAVALDLAATIVVTHAGHAVMETKIGSDHYSVRVDVRCLVIQLHIRTGASAQYDVRKVEISATDAAILAGACRVCSLDR